VDTTLVVFAVLLSAGKKMWRALFRNSTYTWEK